MRESLRKEPDLSLDWDEEQVDVQDLLHPEDSTPDGRPSHPVSWEQCSFVHYYDHPKPQLYNEFEYYSSRGERLRTAAPRLPDLAARKAAHRRIRIIILADIVLFLVILGVVYPSLRKLQSSGKLAGYRFSLSATPSIQQWEIVVKSELLAGTKGPESYHVRFLQDGTELLQGQRALPGSNSPVNYALFSILYTQLAIDSGNNADLEVEILVGQEQKSYFLTVTKAMKP